MIDDAPASSPAAGELGADIYCPVCAYQLFGLTSEKCPECGHDLANLWAGECGIPWEHRKTIGRLRAYDRTVRLVVFHPLRFSEEYSHEVDYVSARRFQVVTVLLAYVPLLALTLHFYFTSSLERVPPSADQAMFFWGLLSLGQLIQAAAEVWPVALVHVCFLLFLFAATGAPSYFFHSGSVSVARQNAAVALSYYGSATLLFYAIAGIIFVSAIEFDGPDSATGFVAGINGWVYASPPLICLLFWWRGLYCLMRRIMPQLRGRRFLLGISFPFVWITFALLSVVVLPLVVLYVFVLLYCILT